MSDFGNEHQRIIKAAAVGVCCSVILTVLLTCLFGVILNLTSGIPYGIIDYVTIGIEGFSVLIGAYIACVIAKCKGLIIGALCGAICLLIVTACGLSIAKNDIGILTMIRSAVMIICSVIGGIAGVNRKEKVRIK